MDLDVPAPGAAVSAHLAQDTGLAPTAARLGAALRAIRIQRHLSQVELAEMAGLLGKGEEAAVWSRKADSTRTAVRTAKIWNWRTKTAYR